MRRKTSLPSVPPSLLRALAVVCFLPLPGCGSPDKAAIALRRKVNALGEKIAELDRRHAGDAATIDALQRRASAPATSAATTASAFPAPPVLPPALLDALYTAHGLKLGRLTGEGDLDPAKPGSEGLKVYAVPVDENGDALKAVGAFTIEAFDLTAAEHPALAGKWTFDPRRTRDAWYGAGLLHTFVFKCPWPAPPAHEALTVKVTFTDALTGREFTEQRAIKIKPPAADVRTKPPEK